MELKKLKFNSIKYTYHSNLLRKFINGLAKRGKVHQIERALFKSLANLKFKVYLNPLILFLFILNEVKPCILLKSLRLGSVVYQIPTPLVPRKQLKTSIKLIVNLIKTTKYVGPLEQKIEREFFLILSGKSSLYKTTSTLYQTASNARAFAHYR
jgi:ribosomal protein S7